MKYQDGVGWTTKFVSPDGGDTTVPARAGAPLVRNDPAAPAAEYARNRRREYAASNRNSWTRSGVASLWSCGRALPSASPFVAD
jgi:hypothetical protein